MEKFKKNNNSASPAIGGKLPPQAPDMEEAVLGALMVDKDAYLQVSGILKPESFYSDANKKVFKAIQTLFAKSSPIDILTVTAELRRSNELEFVGGAFYVTNLTSRVASGANIEHHAYIVEQKFIQRETIRICTETIKDAYDDSVDVIDLTDKHQTSMYELMASGQSRSFSEVSDIIPKRLIEYERKPVDGLTGVGTGFGGLDNFTSGWQPSDLIILAARPAMGKTALALQLGKHAAIKHKVPVAIFSLEMSQESLVDRLISSESGVFQDKIKKRELNETDWMMIHQNINPLLESKIFIDQTTSVSISEMRAKALRLKEMYNVGLILVDYLQLMKGASEDKSSRETRDQSIGKISRGLKIIAKDLNVPVIALAQLSRAVESRPDKRPLLSDLRDSGSIEQDADQVIFLYRPEYYGINEDEEGNPTQGIVELIFAKNRNGVCDTVTMMFNGAQMKFSDLNEIENAVPQSNKATSEFTGFTLIPNKDFDSAEPPF